MSKTRILVVSDTHGNDEILKKLVKKYEHFEYLIHLGDHIWDIDDIEFKGKVLSIKGNADRGAKGASDRVFTIDGYNIWLTHGHLYCVKFGLNKLFYSALEKKADIVIFGHTHVALNINYENMLFFNPGSLAYPRGTNIGSYGIIEFDKKKINANILEFD